MYCISMLALFNSAGETPSKQGYKTLEQVNDSASSELTLNIEELIFNTRNEANNFRQSLKIPAVKHVIHIFLHILQSLLLSSPANK